MGLFYDTFHEQIARLWDKAHATKKPIHEGLSWTCGIISSRGGDFLDLQTHGIALAASIILQSDVVPKIYIGWDTGHDHESFAHDSELRLTNYPLFMFDRFGECYRAEALDSKLQFASFDLRTRYVELRKSCRSINSWPRTLAQGYRAKYLGMQYVMTNHAVISDIDTICVAPCVGYLDEQIAIDPKTFCITNWYNSTRLSVGLCVYNVTKYRMIFEPLLARDYWTTWRQDSSFVQFVRNNHPEYVDILDLRLMDKNKISTERYHQSRTRRNYWTPNTMFYHAWKGDQKTGKQEFMDYYQTILDDLERLT